jgi:hypothetical protein
VTGNAGGSSSIAFGRRPATVSESLSQPDWYVRAFQALVSPEPLSPKRCVQACAILGGLTGGAAALVLLLGTPPPSLVTPIAIQASVGASLLFGAALSWERPALLRPYLLLVGIALVGAVASYPAFMAQALMSREQSGVKRFGHAPGALAMGLAFGLRLVVDLGVHNEDLRRGIARRAGIAGLAVGGCLDAFVLYVMFFGT